MTSQTMDGAIILITLSMDEYGELSAYAERNERTVVEVVRHSIWRLLNDEYADKEL